jgi:uncharacterized protein
VNNSASTTSPVWPTRWPSASFAPGPTALFLTIVIAACVIIGIGGIAWLFAEYGSQLRSGVVPVVPAIVFQLILEGTAVIAILVALPRLSKFSLRQLGFKPMGISEIGLGIVGAIAMIVIVEGGATLLETLMHQKHEQDVVQLFRQVRGQPFTLWFFTIFAVVLAPFMEETIFRTFFFNLGLRYGGYWVGAILSGILFGAAHADVFVFLPLMLGGMLLSYIYYRSGNAFVSMISHGIFNGATILAILFVPQLAT